MEPDRWAEEIRRGLTIDLGYCWTSLESGTEIAFVDVPGHERFVANTLAGVGPCTAVMFVVAADEGWRAQSEEHLTAIDALGVRHGLLAVTRSDLADPAIVDYAVAEATERIARTSLGEVEAVAVSAVTGEGVPALRSALGRMCARLPEPDPDADVRLWVDRSFSITGHGTVVTGTLGAGTIRVGDQLAVAGGERVPRGGERRVRGGELRVRGLQALKTQHQQVSAVARVAVNLRGIDPAEVTRGTALVTPGQFLPVAVADVRLAGLDAGSGAPAARPGPSALDAADAPAALMLHIGTAAVPARLRPLGPDTARLTLRRALPLRIGDTAVLRDPGRQAIVAGARILDVRPPGLGRRGAAQRRGAELASVTATPDLASELRRRKLARGRDLRAMGVPVPARAPRVAGDWLAEPAWWRELGDRLRAEVEAHAAADPVNPGLPVEAARRRLGLPGRSLVEALVEALAESRAAPGAPAGGSVSGSGSGSGSGPRLRQADGRIYGPGGGADLPARVRDAIEAIRAGLRDDPFLAPDAERLRDLGLDPRQLAAAVKAGYLIRVSREVYLLPGAAEEAVQRLAAIGRPFTLSEARRALGTTRRVAVPLLEMLDRSGHTERLDDTLRQVRRVG
jgi:selenocysteine-specific elongation factor